jgi:hypothetical protein
MNETQRAFESPLGTILSSEGEVKFDEADWPPVDAANGRPAQVFSAQFQNASQPHNSLLHLKN